MLAGLLATGLSATLRTASESAAAFGPRPFGAALTVIIYVIGLSVINEIGSLPIAFYSGFAVERRVWAVDGTASRMVKDQAKSFAVGC